MVTEVCGTRFPDTVIRWDVEPQFMHLQGTLKIQGTRRLTKPSQRFRKSLSRTLLSKEATVLNSGIY